VSHRGGVTAVSEVADACREELESASRSRGSFDELRAQASMEQSELDRTLLTRNGALS